MYPLVPPPLANGMLATVFKSIKDFFLPQILARQLESVPGDSTNKHYLDITGITQTVLLQHYDIIIKIKRIN